MFEWTGHYTSCIFPLKTAESCRAMCMTAMKPNFLEIFSVLSQSFERYLICNWEDLSRDLCTLSKIFQCTKGSVSFRPGEDIRYYFPPLNKIERKIFDCLIISGSCSSRFLMAYLPTKIVPGSFVGFFGVSLGLFFWVPYGSLRLLKAP